MLFYAVRAFFAFVVIVSRYAFEVQRGSHFRIHVTAKESNASLEYVPTCGAFRLIIDLISACIPEA